MKEFEKTMIKTNLVADELFRSKMSIEEVCKKLQLQVNEIDVDYINECLKQCPHCNVWVEEDEMEDTGMCDNCYDSMFPPASDE